MISAPLSAVGKRREITLLAITILTALAVARLPLMPLAAMVGGTAIVMVTLIEPLSGLALTLVIAPLAAYTNYMTGAVLRPLDIGQMMLGLALGAWLLRGLARREIRLPLVPLLWPLLIFVGWATISLLWAQSFEYAIPEVIKWVQVVLIMLIVVEARDRRSLGWVIAGMLASGVLQAALGIWQYGLRGIGPETFKISEHLYRAYGSFEQPNPYAGYIGLIWPIAAGLLIGQISNLRARIPKGRAVMHLASRGLPLATCAMLLISALVFSWSRGAWLGALAAIVVMAAALPRRIWLGVGGVALAVAVLLGANTIGVLPGAIRSRLTDFTQQAQVFDARGVGINDANYAVLERLAHWQVAGEMIRYHPWTGVGFSNYEPAYPQYALMNWPIPLGHAHNYYLNVLAESGIVGLGAYLVLWGVIFWTAWRAVRSTRGLAQGIAAGAFGVLIALSVHNLFDDLFVHSMQMEVGITLGLMQVVRSERSGDPAFIAG